MTALLASNGESLTAARFHPNYDPDQRPSWLPWIQDCILSSLDTERHPLDWDTLRAAARLVQTPDGRPIRTIITGRRHIVTGSYGSRKAGHTFPFEGMVERDFLMHSEVDTRVVDYRAQPFRFEFVLDGDKRVYIADAVRLLDDGRLEVIEVKKDWRALKDPEYALKLECVAYTCGLLGWDFRVLTEAAIRRSKVYHQNVEQVQGRRTVPYGSAEIYRAADAIAGEGGSAPLGQVAEALGDARQGMAIAQSMMVGRVLHIDLERPLGADNEVRLIAPQHYGSRLRSAS